MEREFVRKSLAARAKFQALEAGGDVEADLTLHAERLERDRIVGAAGLESLELRPGR